MSPTEQPTIDHKPLTSQQAQAELRLSEEQTAKRRKLLSVAIMTTACLILAGLLVTAWLKIDSGFSVLISALFIVMVAMYVDHLAPFRP